MGRESLEGAAMVFFTARGGHCSQLVAPIGCIVLLGASKAVGVLNGIGNFRVELPLLPHAPKVVQVLLYTKAYPFQEQT